MAWLEKQSLLKQHTNVCLNTPTLMTWLENKPFLNNTQIYT
jgi:hypothetical protein